MNERWAKPISQQLKEDDFLIKVAISFNNSLTLTTTVNTK